MNTKPLTQEEIITAKSGSILRSGSVMTSDYGQVNWVASRGYASDWTITFSADRSESLDRIAAIGWKLGKTGYKGMIQRLTACTHEAYESYRK